MNLFNNIGSQLLLMVVLCLFSNTNCVFCALRTWNWEVFGDIHQHVEDDLIDLETLQHDVVCSGGSNLEFAKEIK